MIVDIKKDYKSLVIVHVILPVVVGILLYLTVFRDMDIAVFLGIYNGGSILHRNILFQGIRNYLPDAIWGYALMSALTITAMKNEINRAVVIVIATVFVFVMESIQCISFVPGYFDTMDIAVEIFAAFAAYVFINIGIIKEEK